MKNPVTDHFPPNTYKISEWSSRGSNALSDLPLALSGDTQTVRLSEYLPRLPQTHSIAVFVGAMARGKDDFADGVVDEKISISNYPLSASVSSVTPRRRTQLIAPCARVCQGRLRKGVPSARTHFFLFWLTVAPLVLLCHGGTDGRSLISATLQFDFRFPI